MPKPRKPLYDDFDDESEFLDDDLDDESESLDDDLDDESESPGDDLDALEDAVELNALLEGLSLDELRAIAKRRGWNLTSSAKAAIVAQLAAHLQAAPQPSAFAAEEEQLLRIENTRYGLENQPSQAELDAVWIKRGGGDLARLARALAGLQSAGVLFRCTRERGLPHYHWSPFARSAQLPLLRPKAQPCPPAQIQRLNSPAPIPPLLALADAALEFAARAPLRLRAQERDPKITALPYVGEWDYQRGEVEKSSPGGAMVNTPYWLTIPFAPYFADETLDALATFTGESRAFADWLVSLLMTPGLIKAQDDAQAVLDAAKVQQWRALPPEEQYRRLWQAWRVGVTALGELERALSPASLVVRRVITATTFKPSMLTEEIGRARQFLARLLTRLEPAAWYEWASFAEYMRDLRPDFIHTTTTAQTWFIAPSQTQHAYTALNPRDWERAYRPILAAMLEGALHWFGAVELGYSEERLAAFQITPLGAWLLTEGKAGSPPVFAAHGAEDAEPITWLDEATFRVRATPATASLLAAARSFAEPTRQMLTFHLSASAIARALEHGSTSAEIAQRFADAGAVLPAALRERIAALEANFGRVRVYERLTLLELADDLALRELLVGTTLRQYIVHQFSPRLVVVRDEAVQEFVNELVKKGYTPRVK